MQSKLVRGASRLLKTNTAEYLVSWPRQRIYLPIVLDDTSNCFHRFDGEVLASHPFDVPARSQAGQRHRRQQRPQTELKASSHARRNRRCLMTSVSLDGFRLHVDTILGGSGQRRRGGHARRRAVDRTARRRRRPGSALGRLCGLAGVSADDRRAPPRRDRSVGRGEERTRRGWMIPVQERCKSTHSPVWLRKHEGALE